MYKFFKSKKFFILLVSIVLISLIIFPYISYEKQHPLKASLIHMGFKSNINNLKSKNINYKVFMKNNSSKEVKYQLTILRKDSENYPYLNSIPEKYVTEIYTINQNESKYLEITDTFLSNQDNNTGGFYDNFDISIEYK